MKPGRQPLDVLQRWMLSIISHPGGVDEGINSIQAQREIEVHPDQLDEVISPSQKCTSRERLAVYGNAYFTRLLECLQAEYPAVDHAVGEDAFRSFVAGYLKDYPPGSYTLNALGQFFPAYLAQTKPSSQVELGWEDFIIELAIVERLFSDVFDGPGEEGQQLLSEETIRAVPPEKWGEMRLITADSLRLCPCQFPVHEYISSVRNARTPEFSTPAPTWLVVHRVDYVVRRQAVSEVAWRLLRGLQQRQPLRAAIELAMNETDTEFDVLISELGTWFRDWTVAGYFQGIEE